MTPAEIQADAKLAGEILSAIWAMLPPQQKAAIEGFALRAGKRVAAVAFHAVLAFGTKRLMEGTVGFPELEELYASPPFPMDGDGYDQGPPPPGEPGP